MGVEGMGLLHDSIQAMFVELTKLNYVLKKPVKDMTDMERLSGLCCMPYNLDYSAEMFIGHAYGKAAIQ